MRFMRNLLSWLKMNNHLLLGHLGLALRARKIISGEEQVLESIRKQSAKIVFLANDAGVNTTKRITDKASFYHVQLVTALSGEELSRAIGKENRKVLAVTDRHFVQMIQTALQEL